ncbi:MAG: hypothetical protein JZU65_19905 [Chlorobium sp.]|jgi:hypothetical protein|uniref:hypothetical protein n=1 Tax=Pelodictyon phaeoclathratiforme TaxID=34090 RepID=UPI0005A29AB0|nr:hypothetical protein [Pelodictyon phaeoclathratiforme]MBV5329861.1 hypothetical protein [Chlorobium sp.]
MKLPAASSEVSVPKKLHYAITVTGITCRVKPKGIGSSSKSLKGASFILLIIITSTRIDIFDAVSEDFVKDRSDFSCRRSND